MANLTIKSRLIPETHYVITDLKFEILTSILITLVDNKEISQLTWL